MRRGLRAAVVSILLPMLTGACVVRMQTPAPLLEPRLDLERFFDGPTTAVGTVSNRFGKVTRRFRANAEGSWSEADQALTVRETWYWDDGEVEPRLWRWEKLGDGTWQGYEDDLDGAATGDARGNLVHWRYVMQVETNAFGRLSIHADDVMHLVDEDDIINLVDMYLWGFLYVGQVVLHIERGDGRAIEPFVVDREVSATSD